MTDTLLHAVAIPSDSQTETGASRRKKLAKQGVLQSDVPSTETVAPQPGQRRISGQIRGRLAAMHARMIEELLSSSIETVPYAAVGEAVDIDGYYAPEDIDVSRLDAREDRLQQFSGVLSPKGTRRSHWRAARTNPQTLDNPFGSDTAPEFGLTIRARKTRWYNSTDGTIVDATAQRTVDGEHDRLDIYDTDEPSFDGPILLYDIAYTDEYPTDCRVWDTYDRQKESEETDGTSTVGSATIGDSLSTTTESIDAQWQRVYVTDHEWRGDMVLETDRLRLVINQPEDDLRAYRWSDSNGQYTLVQLGQSDWRLYDVNLTDVGLAQLQAQFEFENLSSGARHNLNGTLLRGFDDVIWTVPTNEWKTPSGLVDRLDPIAATTDKVPAPTVDVIKRTETDR